MVFTPRTRRILGLLILLISLAFLLWGFWPLDSAVKTVPLPPEELQLPTPVGFSPATWTPLLLMALLSRTFPPYA